MSGAGYRVIGLCVFLMNFQSWKDCARHVIRDIDRKGKDPTTPTVTANTHRPGNPKR